jgi:CHAD domain-containing protein
VYVLRLRKSGMGPPLEVQGDLGPLVEYLRTRQSEEHARLVRLTRSRRYGRLLSEWDGLLNTGDSSPPASDRPIVEQASRRIWKVYRRILRLGRRVDENPRPESLHKIRIECKKLRYLLESFRSLYEPKFIRRQVRVLKGLQDILGEYNDMRVQREKLCEFAQGMTSKGSVPATTFLAMGQMAERLAGAQTLERRRFHRRFDAFADRANRDHLLSRLKPHLGGRGDR